MKNRTPKKTNDRVPCIIKSTVIDLFSALCAKLFQSGGKFLKYFFFLLSAHFNRLLYIEGNEFKG